MNLFEEFSPVTAQQWKEQIVKDLKGIDFNQLLWPTVNGITVKPFYTAEDLGTTPQPLTQSSGWDICEDIHVSDAKEANARALEALKGGASGLVFTIHQKTDLKALLKDISLEHIYSQFNISNDALHVLEELKSIYGQQNAFDGKIKCFVNIDPLHLFSFYGEWHNNKEKDFSVLQKLVHVPVNISLYKESGANSVNELAAGLAHLNEYFNYLDETKQLDKKMVHATFSVSGDFFTEIATLRAFRKLVSFLQGSYGTNLPLHIHTQTARINKSSMDAYSNMLRTTTEAMSAVIGGSNSLSVLPFNDGFDKASSFSSRIARNQQHVLKEESYLDKVADISAGSYYIETLTEQLAEKAWEQFKSIEAKGGFIACMENGFIQELIDKDAEIQLQQLQDGAATLVGVNKFQNKNETPAKPHKTSLPASATNGILPLKPIRLAESFEANPQSKN